MPQKAHQNVLLYLIFILCGSILHMELIVAISCTKKLMNFRAAFRDSIEQSEKSWKWSCVLRAAFKHLHWSYKLMKLFNMTYIYSVLWASHNAEGEGGRKRKKWTIYPGDLLQSTHLTGRAGSKLKHPQLWYSLISEGFTLSFIFFSQFRNRELLCMTW